MTIRPVNNSAMMAVSQVQPAQRAGFGDFLGTAGKVFNLVKGLPSFGTDYMKTAGQVESLVTADQLALGDKATKLTEIASRIKHSWPMIQFVGERLIMPIGSIIAAL